MDDPIASVARKQHGIVTRRQALEAGLTARQVQHRLERGSWIRAANGIYRLDVAPQTSHQRLLIACFASGGVASHSCACRLWEVPGFDEEIIELSVPHTRWRSLPGATLHRLREPLRSPDITEQRWIPITSRARTLIDIAATLDRLTVAESLDHMLKRRAVTLRQMWWQLERSGRRAGVGTIRKLLEARDPSCAPAESALETRILDLLRGGRIRGMVPQYEVRDANGHLRRVDIAIPELKIAIEIDGGAWHDGHADRDRDAARDNALTTIGWLVLRFRWKDLEHPERIVATVRRAIAYVRSIRSAGGRRTKAYAPAKI